MMSENKRGDLCCSVVIISDHQKTVLHSPKHLLSCETQLHELTNVVAIGHLAAQGRDLI